MNGQMINEAIAERDQILMVMDVEAAKVFIAKHGGFVPKGHIDWIKVLHLARFEAKSIAPELVSESHIWLARNGAQSLMTMPPSSPYVRAALDLIFPKDLTDAYVKAMS
jgi:hypothetical protein